MTDPMLDSMSDLCEGLNDLFDEVDTWSEKARMLRFFYENPEVISLTFRSFIEDNGRFDESRDEEWAVTQLHSIEFIEGGERAILMRTSPIFAGTTPEKQAAVLSLMDPIQWQGKLQLISVVRHRAIEEIENEPKREIFFSFRRPDDFETELSKLRLLIATYFTKRLV